MERMNGPPVLVRTFFSTLDDVMGRLVRATLVLLHTSQIWVDPNILPIIRRAMERAFLGVHLNINKSGPSSMGFSSSLIVVVALSLLLRRC